jgi:hypothetical protein
MLVIFASQSSNDPNHRFFFEEAEASVILSLYEVSEDKFP